MNKFVILILSIVIVIISVSLYLFLSRDIPKVGPTTQTTQSPINLPPPNPAISNEDQIKQAVKSSSATDFSELTFSQVTISDNYALQLWYDENIGGEALLEYRTGSGWEIVSFGGGAWSVESLVQQGVPVGTAQALVDKRTY